MFISISVFFEVIVQFFEVLLAQKENVILAGDIHMDQDEHYPNHFTDILNTFNMCQHVKFPTHKLGHTLDIIATFVDDPKIACIESSEYDLSHHFLVEFDVAVVPQLQVYKMIKYRNIIDWNQFNRDIDSGLNISDTASFED